MTTKEWLKKAVRTAKKNFRFYSESIHKVTSNGQEFSVKFFCLGCNASHFFYIGILPDDRLAYRSFGEKAEEIPIEFEDEEGNTVHSYDRQYEEHVEVLNPGEQPGYIGHW